MSAAHAPFAPSAMARIALCPASWRACAGLADIPSPYGQDGTEAHATLAWCLENSVQRVPMSQIEKWTHRADNAQERLDSVQTALDYVYEVLDTYDDAILHVEKRVHFPSIVTDDCWGTADVIIIVPSLGLMYVPDYKHGAGVYVDIEDNLQTGVYAASALHAYADSGPIGTVVNAIIQPRAFSVDGPIRERVLSSEFLTGEFIETVDSIIMAAMDPNAPFVPGTKQCQFCPLKANCPARESAAMSVVNPTFNSVKDVTRDKLPPVTQLPIDRLAYIMSAAGVLRGWLDDVEAAAYEMARAGHHIPGFKLVETRPRRHWHEDEEATAANLMMLTGLDEDQVRPRKLIGITEAEKLVVDAFKANAGRGKKKQAAEDGKRAMADLTTKRSSGTVTLVPIDDERPAINVTAMTFQPVAAIPPPQE